MALLPIPERGRPPIRLALTGANGGYGRTLLAQLLVTPEIVPSALVDPDLNGLKAMLSEIGPAGRSSHVASDAAHASRIIASGATALVPDGTAIPWDDLDVLVEASGKIGPGTAYASTALETGTHVVMVSKEVDTVAGPALHRHAASAGLSYLMADGDQPGNLLRLIDWVSAVGLDIVALGKSGEYDLELDPEAGTLSQAGVTIETPGFTDFLTLGDDPLQTLAARADLASALKRSAAADSCEMTVVAQRIGHGADVESMHYPIARIDELADIYSRRADGGIIESNRAAVDVFSALRLPGEASFAGGVFAIVRTGDRSTWEMLRGKGHVISHDGRYACIYWPYHYMGVETPLTIHAAVDLAPTRPPEATTLLAARTAEPLSRGTELRVTGHHHEIEGVTPAMVPPRPDVTTYYLLDGARLRRDLPRGHLIGEDDVEGIDPGALALHRAGRTDLLN